KTRACSKYSSTILIALKCGIEEGTFAQKILLTIISTCTPTSTASLIFSISLWSLNAFTFIMIWAFSPFFAAVISLLIYMFKVFLKVLGLTHRFLKLGKFEDLKRDGFFSSSKK